MLYLLALGLPVKIVREVFQVLSLTLLFLVQYEWRLRSLTWHFGSLKRQEPMLHEAINLLQFSRARLAVVNFSETIQRQKIVDA